MSAGMMLRLTANGLVDVCRQKPNGKSLPQRNLQQMVKPYPLSNVIIPGVIHPLELIRQILMDTQWIRSMSELMPQVIVLLAVRQMIGNVWEWTQDSFTPYTGYELDMYQDYSRPLFGITKVLRDGAWTTRGRMIRNCWRTYYGPDRNDVFAGFRTCTL